MPMAHQRQLKIQAHFQQMQDAITSQLEMLDGAGSFREDVWSYARGTGGGRSRVLQGGRVFESAGVNFSALGGDHMPGSATEKTSAVSDGVFWATGVSLVIHPVNPNVPTIHMNVRYLQTDRMSWFGGGIDLTPYRPQTEVVRSFHAQLASLCDKYDASWYPTFKKQCDQYFTLPHRGEMRGSGGIFFDRLPVTDMHESFVVELGNAFNSIYSPIVIENCTRTYTPEQRDFQLLRRGRYVEFNLLWDRGTKFGIESGGRAESILVSMPAQARWENGYTPVPGSEQDLFLREFVQPKDWLNRPGIKNGANEEI